MKRTLNTAEQIIRKPKTVVLLIAKGKSVAVDCRVIKVALPVFHSWQQQYGDIQAEQAKTLPQLE